MTTRLIRGSGYEISYGGGRLADVHIDGTPVETVQVRDYDWSSGALGPVPSDDEIRDTVRAFLAEAGGLGLYIDNAR